ncbi:acetaldehyde dehydrogenase (acetylating) [Cupriavidus basilensis]
MDMKAGAGGSHPPGKHKVAIIGSGNIGTDLMIKVMRHGQHLEMGAMVGIDACVGRPGPGQRASALPRTAEGIDRPGRRWTAFGAIRHRLRCHFGRRAFAPRQDPARSKRASSVIDLTPAAIGPYVACRWSTWMPAARRPAISIWLPAAARPPSRSWRRSSRVAQVHYAEIVASISSKSAGPGTRANIDEFTETTSQAICSVGGAARGKAIIVLNPAEPPLMMRDTVYTLIRERADDSARSRPAWKPWRSAVQRLCARLPAQAARAVRAHRSVRAVEHPGARADERV